MRIKLQALIFIFFVFAVTSLAGEWRRLGPVTGTILGIAADRRHPSVYYAINGTARSGGLYRSVNDGQSWIPTSIKGATSVVVGPRSSEVFVTILPRNDSKRVLWVSKNQGQTFLLQSTDAPVRLFPHPTNPSILFGLSYSYPINLVSSFNKGRTWQTISSLPFKAGHTYRISPNCQFDYYELNDVLISPLDGKTVYASGQIFFQCGAYDYDQRSVIFRSTDLGKFWRVSQFKEYKFSYDPAFPDRAFSFDSDIYHPSIRILTNKGWQVISHQPVISLVAMPNRSNELYAVGWEPYFGAAQHFISEDGGRRWQTIQLGPGNGIRILAGRETPPGTLLGGTAGGGLYSVNTNGQWQPQQNGFHEATLIDLAGGPPSSILYVISRGEACCGSDSFLYRSADNGKTWQNITDQLPTADTAAHGLWGLISDPKDAKHVIVQVGAQTVVSFDAGESWRILKQQDLLNTYFHPVTNDVYFSSYSHVFRSSDGGLSVEELPLKLPTPYIAFTDLAFDLNTNTMYLGSDRGMYVSTDGGRSMHPIGPERHHGCDACWVSSIVQLSGAGNFLIASASGIYKTTDGGVNWKRLSATPDYYPKLYPTDPQGHHIFCIRDVLNESKDGGVSWKDISRQMNAHLTHSDLTVSAMTNPLFLPWFFSTRLGLYSRK